MKTKSNMTVKENKLNKQLNGLIDNQPTNTGLIKPNKQNISLCHSCYCMTKTINEKCGKCGGIKPLTELLKAKPNKQRTEIIKEIEGIVGEDENTDWEKIGYEEACSNESRNELRKEIRERLKQITNLKEK